MSRLNSVWASLIAQLPKNLPAIKRPWFDSWLGKFAAKRIDYPLQYSWAFLVAQLVKTLPTIRETWV